MLMTVGNNRVVTLGDDNVKVVGNDYSDSVDSGVHSHDWDKAQTAMESYKH